MLHSDVQEDRLALDRTSGLAAAVCRPSVEEVLEWQIPQGGPAGHPRVLGVLAPGEPYLQARSDTMHDLGTLLRQLRCCWMLVGDWNQRPEDMASSGLPSFVHGAIVSINESTCKQGNGSIIDYVIVHRGLETAVKMELDEESPWSPHQNCS